MLYAVIGTHKETREKAHKELASFGAITRYIYSEQAGDLESLINATSLFEETDIVTCVQLGDTASSKEVLMGLLSSMGESKNIFIIDEPFADIHLYNKIHKVAKKIFDGREEKIKDTSVFKLCDSFAARDKKQAWLDFMSLREKGEGEAIQGALWWKFQTVWQAGKNGRTIPFTEAECEQIGGDLVRASILAHRGQKDLMTELERIILSL